MSMATNLITFRPTRIHACAVPSHHIPDPNCRKPSSVSVWWAPIFGWSSDSDYIEPDNPKNSRLSMSKSGYDPKPAGSRFLPGCFTEDKAKQLRMMTKETASFHDAMYHSAIASRLATDFETGSDE